MPLLASHVGATVAAMYTSAYGIIGNTSVNMSDNTSVYMDWGRTDVTDPADRRTLLQRPERRRSLIAAAARAFSRAGFAGTSLEDVAAEAGVSRVLIYRHFDSKAELYQAVLDDVGNELMQATGAPDNLEPTSIAGLVQVARANPDGFRLYFRH